MTLVTVLGRRLGRRSRRAGAPLAAASLAVSLAVSTLLVLGGATAADAGTAHRSPLPPAGRIVPAQRAAGDPDLGTHTYVFDPSMSVSDIQATVDAVAAKQLGNQFGRARYALLFKPGTYGSDATPLNFQVGYYTEVAGLGQDPGDVVINGSVDVYNQCDDTGSCIALNNFWRSLSNLTIHVTNPDAGCQTGEFWAASQAAPMRRVHVDGAATLMDYCTGPSFASGGFIADSQFTGGSIVNGSQQQYFVRNTELDGWSNSVWNQVFSGDTGATPAECFTCQPSTYYTTVARTPVSREKPYLYVDDSGAWRVFVPSAARSSSGPSWVDGSTPGRSLPLSRFFVAHPSDSARTIDQALAQGRDLLLTPGVYGLGRALAVTRADTVVLGLGLPSLTPRKGNAAILVDDVAGVDLAGITIDAGAQRSPVLVRVGDGHGHHDKVAGRGSDPADPTALQDVFFRVGGPQPGKAKVSLEVDSDDVVLDDIWAWRADHGNGVGWTQNTAATGLVVKGDRVSATGLFVEHYQKFQVRWTGEKGQVLFFQSEMPYDVPSQAAWRSAPGTDGYAAIEVGPRVQQFSGSGMGTYSFFNQGLDIFADHAYEVPAHAGVRLHDLLTIFLDATNGKGGIRHVVNDVGDSSTVANPDTPVTVVDYP